MKRCLFDKSCFENLALKSREYELIAIVYFLTSIEQLEYDYL